MNCSRHRNEPTGALHGLFRLAQFTQDDGHLFCLEAQVVPEVARFARSLLGFYEQAGFSEVRVALATRPDVRAGDEALWDRAENLLAEAAQAAGLVFERHPGEGAFYGPKLEFTLQDRRGRDWQCGTIQLDFVLPERFDLQCSGPNGAPIRPVMSHRALLGSLERFLGILLEHHNGARPPWLAPEQVLLAPVEPQHGPLAESVAIRLRQAGLRARIAPADQSLGRRVREARDLRIPWFLALGDQEAAGAPWSIRPLKGPAQRLPEATALSWMLEGCR